jgi:hypothetical protein
VALENLSHKKMYPYRCDNPDCLEQIWAYGDDDPLLRKFIDEHNPCPKLMQKYVEDFVNIEEEDTNGAARRWRWGTQQWQQNKCERMHQKGIVTETYHDVTRPRGQQYGYRRSA